MFSEESLYKELQEQPFIIAGPCVVEEDAIMQEIAEKVKKACDSHGFKFVFKASYDKANRTSVKGFRGRGMIEGLKALRRIQEDFEIPVLTDIHESHHAAVASEFVDILQIPAFLCRQTDLLWAAAETGKIVNIKKGQFLTGAGMKHAADKVKAMDNPKIILTERGNSFGNYDLVVDYRNLFDMQALGYPVVMDVTHSVQQPGGAGDASSGNRAYIPCIATAAAGMGIQSFFFETHPRPEEASSDGPNMLPLKDFDQMLAQLSAIIQARKSPAFQK